jgi:mono/diheme cytochrome c family protein
MTLRRFASLLGAFVLAASGPVRAEMPAAPPGVMMRGEYLAKIGGCASCHTKQKDGIAFAGGRPVPSPLGAIISTNITPDPAHGIGRYSVEDFVRVMREGTAPGSKHLYPAMPYTSYAKMDDADLQALYTYLRHGVAPSDHVPPPTRLPFPFDQRWALRFWKMAFLPRGVYAPKAAQDAVWNRGAYLVQSAGHCGACHTPRGVGFQERGYDESARRFLTGMVNDHWFASNLTGDPGAGLGRIEAATIAAFLKTGHGDGLVAFGTMGEEVEQSLQYLTAADAHAIAHYLKALPARRGEGSYRPASDVPRGLQQGNRTGDVESTGAAVYRSFCSQCHQVDGRGVSNVFPRLAGNPSVLSDDASSLIRLVLEGGHSPTTLHGPVSQSMPGYAQTLTDVHIAQVLTHVRQAWGNDAKPVTTSDVAKLHGQLQK